MCQVHHLFIYMHVKFCCLEVYLKLLQFEMKTLVLIFLQEYQKLKNEYLKVCFLSFLPGSNEGPRENSSCYCSGYLKPNLLPNFRLQLVTNLWLNEHQEILQETSLMHYVHSDPEYFQDMSYLSLCLFLFYSFYQ